jgi:hypothetical protein
MIVGGAIGGAAGSVASQIVGNAIGVQDGFSWKGVAAGAIGGGIGAFAGGPLTGMLEKAGLAGNTLLAARAGISGALSQGVLVATGLQEKFNWGAVAGAAIAAPIANGIGNAVRGAVDGPLGGLVGNFAQGVTRNIIVTGMSGGKINFANIAADAFGNAIGNSIVDGMRPQYTEVEMAQDFVRENARFDRQVAASQIPNENMMGVGVGSGLSAGVYYPGIDAPELIQIGGRGNLPPLNNVGANDGWIPDELMGRKDLLFDRDSRLGYGQKPAISAEAKGNDVVYAFDDGSTETRSGGSRSWRNNNPGNMIQSNNDDSIGTAGAFGSKHQYPVAVFASEEAGTEAMLKNLSTSKYQALTVGDAIKKWAPSDDNNDPVKYGNTVSKWTGLDVKTEMNKLSSEQLKSVGVAIKRYEGWVPGKVTITTPNK